MELKEFIETNIYRDVGYYYYVGLDREELEESEKDLRSENVRYYRLPGGYLEITTDV